MKKLLCTLLCAVLVLSGCAQTPPADANPSDALNSSDGASSELGCSDRYNHAYFNILVEDQQDLDALYTKAPYQDYLPQTVLEGFTFVEGHGVTCAVPEHENLDLRFMNEDGFSLAFGMDVYIIPPIADPEKPETYSIAWYWEWRKSPPPEAYGPLGQLMFPENYSDYGLFRAEDVSEKMLEARTYTYTNEDGEPERTETRISVICGEYRVWYSLSKSWDAGEEPEWIDYKEIYEMITSSKYFQT